jgi:hypothetical protein
MVMSNYLLSIVAATFFAMQAKPIPPTVPKKDTNPLITLTGCVSRDASTPGSYTFSDMKTGAKYRLIGFDVRKDAGKQGEIVVGTGARRVTIRGGLVPSANVAARGSAMDPAQMAIARLPNGTSSGTGDVHLPEFRASRVQALNGSCP